jgi:hypothetical protein
VRPSRLDDVVELLRLRSERVAEPGKRWQQVVDELVECGKVDSRRKTSFDDWPMFTSSLA